jgi:hypothetical protein
VFVAVVVYVLVALFISCDADATEPVSADLVCRVQNAIRWRSPAWAPSECATVAEELNATPEPRTSLAVAINESDLRPRAVAHARPGVYDVGLMGVRCVIERGRCSNGPARGLSIEQLKNPETNIRVAAQIMATKRAHFGGDWLRAYNGGTAEHGYAGRIAALVAALGGVVVETKSARIRRLVERIVAAVGQRVAMGDRQ